MVFTPRRLINNVSLSEHESQVMANHIDDNPLKISSLCGAIALEALNTVIETWGKGPVEFEYAGYRVSVHSGGTVRVEETREREYEPRTSKDDC